MVYESQPEKLPKLNFGAQNCLYSQEVVHQADGPAEQAGCLLAIHQTAKYLSPFESIFSL